MVVVAVAGGSGNVGRTMVETLLELREHEIIVLSRKQSPGVANVESVVVDYGDVGAIAEALTQHDVHTVGWGSLPNKRSPVYAFREASNAELRKTTLEWTRVSNGFFPDYYGSPRVKTHLPTITFAVDIASREAALPGTRNESIAFT
ncbi:Hypothetical protein PENO1_101940 [Penicillium occitanis (nom. inval.)]|nr:Hypothetical protein PENO1_101940 [Penicillium occitanis (nom. inval.)]PCG90598.1 hypothetical protein PENOC_101310 [Penicillium occitanis (nom. inval.)]